MEIIQAIMIGTLFGFALNRVGATNPQNVINMLRLKDTHLLKTILFAIGFSSVLLFVGLSLGLVDSGHLSVKSSYVGVIVGGALLGAGWGLSGYCPGTGVCAAATGRKDGWVFILGGLLGAFAYMLTFDWWKDGFLMEKIAGGKAILADAGVEKYDVLVTGLPGIVVGAGLGLTLMVLAIIIPKKILWFLRVQLIFYHRAFFMRPDFFVSLLWLFCVFKDKVFAQKKPAKVTSFQGFYRGGGLSFFLRISGQSFMVTSTAL